MTDISVSLVREGTGESVTVMGTKGRRRANSKFCLKMPEMKPNNIYANLKRERNGRIQNEKGRIDILSPRVHLTQCLPLQGRSLVFMAVWFAEYDLKSPQLL